jgi:hypothetical protein
VTPCGLREREVGQRCAHCDQRTEERERDDRPSCDPTELSGPPGRGLCVGRIGHRGG